jgi:hypothetical protein
MSDFPIKELPPSLANVADDFLFIYRTVPLLSQMVTAAGISSK